MDTITITVAENDPDVVVSATLNEEAVTITLVEAQDGTNGAGVPVGGSADDILKKTSSTDYATEWETPTSTATANAIVRRDASGGAAFVALTGTGDWSTTGHFLSNPGSATAGHFLTKNGTTPTIAAGRSAWFSSTAGAPQFKNGTGSAVTLIYNGGALGAPSSGTLTSCTALPVSTGISGLGTNVAAFLATPTSANLRTALADKTGSGLAVFADNSTLNSATLNTPYLYSPVFELQAIADIATLKSDQNSPPCVMFEDFLGSFGGGAYPWVDSGTGGTDSGVTGGAGLCFGLVRLYTTAISASVRTRSLSIGPTNVQNGMIWRACFAIPNIYDCAVYIGAAGGGTNFGLYYNYAAAGYGSQWVLYRTGAVITTFTAAVAEAGDFMSGKRYQMTMKRITATTTTLLLEIADWNSNWWSTVFNGTITHAAHTPGWTGDSPSISIMTKTTAVRSLILDWFSMHHSGINRGSLPA
jgi:hypothetical protein